MNIVPNRITIILGVYLLQATAVFAETGPPPPSSPPPPPGLPLDGGIVILGILSMCYGIYRIYKIRNIKKASN